MFWGSHSQMNQKDVYCWRFLSLSLPSKYIHIYVSVRVVAFTTCTLYQTSQFITKVALLAIALSRTSRLLM